MGSGNDTHHFVDVKTGTTTFKFTPPLDVGRVSGDVRFSPDGQRSVFVLGRSTNPPVCGFAVGKTGGRGAEQVVCTNKLFTALGARSSKWPEAVAVSNDGRTVVMGENSVVIWRKDAPLQELRGHTEHVEVVVLNDQADRVLSGGRDGSVFYWSVASGRFVHELCGHKRSIRCAAISPDGRLGATSGDDRWVVLWNLEEGQEENVFFGHSGTVYALAFSPDGKWLASGSDDKTVRLWRLPAKFWATGAAAK
jgi:WD40 repeat protein